MKKLTYAEKQISHLVSLGYNNQEIAEKTFLAPSTICGYITNIYRKLGFTDKGARVKLARMIWMKGKEGME